MGKHQNVNAIRRIESRIGTKERNTGVDFKTNRKAWEFAETKQDINHGINQLSKSRVSGQKTLVVPQRLAKTAKDAATGTGIRVENVGGKTLKKGRRS